MRQAVLFTVLGALCALLAFRAPLPIAWLLAWLGLDLVLVGVSYAARSAALFGKGPGGKRSLWSVVLLLPYSVAAWLSWRLHPLRCREDMCHEVAAGLWVGRRAFGRELPPGVGVVVDLTEVFSKPRDYEETLAYHALPCLDASVPPSDLTMALLEELKACEQGVYVHCAVGHGRSVMFVAMLLVLRGQAASVEEALAAIKNAGRYVHVTQEQRAFAARVLQEMRRTERPPV